MSEEVSNWLIPPGPESSTGVPKPDWYDKPEDQWPPAARQWAKLYSKALHESALVDGAGEALYAIAKEGKLPENWEQMTALVNERLKDFRPSLSSGWKYLEKHEQKMFAALFAEIFDVDVLVHPGYRLEFRYPRQPRGHQARKRA